MRCSCHPSRVTCHKLVRPPRFERGTLCLEGRCSIQLSYGRSPKDISGWLASAQVRLSGGVVMSSTAKAFNRKDGTGKVVCVRHELALQPGLAVWEAFHDPKDGKVKLDGENVVTFPKLPEFQQVTLKVIRWEERDKRLVVKDAELVA